MEITINQWLVKQGHDPAQAGLFVYTGRLLIPRAIWGSALVAHDARLTVMHE